MIPTLPATTLLRTSANSLGQPITYPVGEAPEVTAFLAELAPGQETGWHQHPVQLMGYVLEGALTVYQVTGEKRVVRVGEVSLESVGVLHRGVNEGDVPLKMVVFVNGLKDLPFTIWPDQPAAKNRQIISQDFLAARSIGTKLRRARAGNFRPSSRPLRI